MSKKHLSDALQFLSVHKKSGRDVVYLYIMLDATVPDSVMRDIQNTAKIKFNGEELFVFKFEPHNEMLILANTRRRSLLAEIEKHVAETYRGEARIISGDLGEQGLEYLAKALGKIIGESDRTLKMAHRRLMRQGNSIMVLDDDIITLRTAEKILKNFGFVNTVETPQQFFETYEDYAPNIVFVDIHLKDYKGPPIVKVAREKFDPYIHAVMISSDTAKETILSVKESGAAGFIVKPFNRDTLYQHLLNAPTFVSKTGG
jgi:two-component system chemotaxis response regulator CheY